MVQAIVIGVVTAVLVCLPQGLRTHGQDSWGFAPGWILLVGLVAATLQKWVVEPQHRDSRYHGLADLMIYIHKPLAQGNSLSWVVHGLVSFLLALAGGVAGSEGAAIEWMQAAQMELDSYSARWFEQKRRTQVASILASALGAAFGAPFAGLLLTFELGMGGRSIAAALSAMTAFLTSRWLIHQFSIPQVEFHGVLPQFSFLDWKDWVCLVFVGLVAGGVAALLILVARATREGLSALFKTAAHKKMLVVFALLFCVRWMSIRFNFPPEVLMEQALWSKLNSHQMLFLVVSQFLLVSLLIGGVGSIGWIWPALSLGAVLGCFVFQQILPGVVNVLSAAGLVGAVVFWAVLLNAPLSGAILAFELTQDFHIVFPVWVMGSLAIRMRDGFGVRPLLDHDLVERGQDLFLGRSMSVMSSVSVQDAMVTDYVWVYDNDSQAEVYARISKSPYPIVPVVSRDGRLTGLLTADLLLFETSNYESAHRQVGQFLEAKDLVYQFGVKTPTVQVSDRLKTAVPWFDEFPCIPVLGADQKLLGLLFSSQVRMVYEREVGRRSFKFVPKEKNE